MERYRKIEQSLVVDKPSRVLTMELAKKLSTVGAYLPGDMPVSELINPIEAVEWKEALASLEFKQAKEVRRVFRGAKRGFNPQNVNELKQGLQEKYFIVKVGSRGGSFMKVVLGIYEEIAPLTLGL